VLQLLHIYSVPSNEVMALPVMEGQQSLLLKIQSALHIDTSDQELLTPTGTVADLNTDLSQYCLNQVLVSIYTDLLPTRCYASRKLAVVTCLSICRSIRLFTDMAKQSCKQCCIVAQGL